MYKYLILLLLLGLTVSSDTPQKMTVTINYATDLDNRNNTVIYYNWQRRLSWDDFKGAPDNSIAAAITSSGLGYKAGYSYDDGKAELRIDVYCNFSKDRSWVREGRKTDYILNHEQHHFDVSFLGASRFIQKLKATNFNAANYNEQIEKVYNDCVKEMNAMQNRYDNETKNGQLKDKQEEWNAWIEKQLDALYAVEQTF